MSGLQGKVAIVTGASSGIGAAIVVALTKAGMTVVGVARREENIQELQSQVVGASGKLHAKKADISKDDEVRELFDWVKAKFGTMHVMINNAGVNRYGKIIEQSPQYWRDIFETNVLGLTLCSQQAIKLMRESGVDDGHVIQVNSSNPLLNVYPASKHAVTARTEILKQELRHAKSNIRVTSLSPGMVHTEFKQAADKALQPHEIIDMSNFLGHAPPMLNSDDVASAVLFILSTPPHVQIDELTLSSIK